MKRLMLFLVLLLFPLIAFAGDKVKGTSFFVTDNQNWKTGEKTGYWAFHGKGVANSVEGPLGTVRIECHGAGFWNANGSGGEGICLHGADTDTWTSSWKRDMGQKVGQWKILSGTGKFAGITGEGSYTPMKVSEDRHVSEWEGEVSLAK